MKAKAGEKAAVAQLHASERAQVAHEFTAFEGIQLVRLPAGADVLQAVARYQLSGKVDFAEPDYILHAAVTPDEPSYQNGTLWHLTNTVWARADIHAAAGWNGTNSTTNIVAVIDSGVRYTHEDLAANMWTNPGETLNERDDDHNGVADDIHGVNAVNYDGTNRSLTGDPNDDFWHGTHVAGIIGAVGNNGLGSCGVAWHVKLMACKFLDNTGSGSVAGAVYCINYALDNGAKVINASFADTVYGATLYTAINSCRSAGIIFVAASGNDAMNCDTTPYYPACYNLDNIVSVGATTRYDQLAGYSNYGLTNVDLAAPGSDIYATDNASDSAYDAGTGTSFAAPCVSGAVALMLSRWPSHTYRQIIDRLLASTDPLPFLAGRCVTGGRLNLNRALNHWPATLTLTNGVGAGKIRIKLQGEPHQVYVMQATTNLVSWNPLSTNTAPANGILWYTNTTTGIKFFRAAVTGI